MFRFVSGLRSLIFPWRSAAGNPIQTSAISFCKNTSPAYSYIVVRSPELDDMKGGTGWVTYIKKVGDKIQENDEIAKVDTEFYVVTILAPCEGVLDEVYVPDGYKVKSHQGMFRVRHRVIEEDDTITETPRRVYPNKDQVQKTVEKTIEKTSPRCYQDENVSAPEYVNSICPKTYHNYTEPGDIYKGKSQKLKNRYEID